MKKEEPNGDDLPEALEYAIGNIEKALESLKELGFTSTASILENPKRTEALIRALEAVLRDDGKTSFDTTNLVLSMMLLDERKKNQEKAVTV